MNADALFQSGREPWLPTGDASNLHVLNIYEVPTVGTFDVEGRTFLFECLSGHLDRVGVWAYAPLSRSEVKETHRDFADHEAFEAWLERAFTHREVRFATTVDDEITHWSEGYKVESDPLPAALEFLDCLLEAMLKVDKEQARSRARKAVSRRKPDRSTPVNQVRLDAERREFEALAIA